MSSFSDIIDDVRTHGIKSALLAFSYDVKNWI